VAVTVTVDEVISCYNEMLNTDSRTNILTTVLHNTAWNYDLHSYQLPSIQSTCVCMKAK